MNVIDFMFSGRFYDYPGDDGARKNEFFKLKGDICDPAGCLSELCIQLSISELNLRGLEKINLLCFSYDWQAVCEQFYGILLPVRD